MGAAASEAPGGAGQDAGHQHQPEHIAPKQLGASHDAAESSQGPALASTDRSGLDPSTPARQESLALRSNREPEMRHDDWEAAQAPSHIERADAAASSPNIRQLKLKPESIKESRKKEDKKEEPEEPEMLDQQAADLTSKPCYFDLEKGEAGPSCSERRWHRFRSGATYDGDWQEGSRHGVGKQCWPDGTVYVGEWKRGRANGRGEIRHYDGDIYTGQWVNGRAHGSGVFRHSGSHAIYEGEFQMDMRDGVGVELWVDGSWYAGEFRKGVKQGHGEHRWPMLSGTYYVGGWRGNELAGPGRYYVKDGPSYQGQWMNSVIDGAGVYTWLNGMQYEGQYSMDRKHGFGILTMLDGESRESFWNMGNRCEEDPRGPGARRPSI